MAPDRLLAVLIDIENVDMPLMGFVLEEAVTHGTVAICRAYGNPTKLHDWKECLQSHAIESVRNYTDGRNSTDIALAVGAMDILHTREDINGFCIAASDSDYAGLAKRLRDGGMLVVGMGRSDTPASFQDECDPFTDIEVLSQQDRLAGRVYRKDDIEAVAKIMDAISSSAPQQDGWVLMSEVGTNLKNADPAFKYHTYWHSSLQSLIEWYPREFETRSNMYVRTRPAPR